MTPPIDFPTSPTTNEVYTYNGRSWKFNGEGWEFVFNTSTTTFSTSNPSAGNDGDVWYVYS